MRLEIPIYPIQHMNLKKRKINFILFYTRFEIFNNTTVLHLCSKDLNGEFGEQ